jgi:hypothetical protein
VPPQGRIYSRKIVSNIIVVASGMNTMQRSEGATGNERRERSKKTINKIAVAGRMNSMQRIESVTAQFSVSGNRSSGSPHQNI